MRGAIFPLAGVLAAAFLLVIGDSAASQSRLRIGYVALAGTVPSDRDLFGAPLSGFLRATKRFDVQGKVVYVSPNQDPTAAMASLARQRYDLVIVGFAAVDPVDAVAGKFPRVKFLMPGFPIEALRHPRANVQGTWFRAEEAGYLAGYLAALMEGRRAGKHVVSSVGGFPLPGVDRWIVGYRAGARKADSTAKNLTGYSQDFSNPAKCRTVALSQIARGSGVVFNVAGACGLGALRAAKEARVWGIGVDVDQSYLGRHILTSAIVREDKPVFESIRGLVRGSFKTGGNSVFNLRNDGVGLGKISPAVPRRFLRKLTDIRRQILEGRIKVPRVT